MDEQAIHHALLELDRMIRSLESLAGPGKSIWDQPEAAAYTEALSKVNEQLTHFEVESPNPKERHTLVTKNL